jgi:hypothetical protein
LCINGYCRAECDPASPFNCPALTDCRAYAGKNYCVDASPTGGGSGGGGSGPSGGGPGGGTGGGTGGGSVSTQGCGCGVTASPFALWPALLWALRRRRSG